MRSRMLMASILMLVLLFSIVPNIGYAQGEVLTLQYVVFKMEDGSFVRTTMGDYGRAFSTVASGKKSLLWDTLKGNQSRPSLVGVGSGDKYMTMGEYGRKFSATTTKNIKENLGLTASQITSESIKASEAISATIVATYKQVTYIKDDSGKTIGIEFEPITPPVQEFKVLNIY